MADQSILISAVLPASPMPLFVKCRISFIKFCCLPFECNLGGQNIAVGYLAEPSCQIFWPAGWIKFRRSGHLQWGSNGMHFKQQTLSQGKTLLSNAVGRHFYFNLYMMTLLNWLLNMEFYIKLFGQIPLACHRTKMKFASLFILILLCASDTQSVSFSQA